MMYLHKKFICLDKEHLRINGEFSSLNARFIRLQLQKCDPTKAKCEDPEIVKTFMRNKFLVFLHNQKVFN